jgi:hypothetical protein
MKRFTLMVVFFGLFYLPSFSQAGRIQGLSLSPIIYVSGPDYGENTHAFIDFEIKPGTGLEYINARFTDPVTGEVYWLVKNLPIPPTDNFQPLSFRINTEFFTPGYTSLNCDLSVGADWILDPNFIADIFVPLSPVPVIYDVGSGSDDSPVILPSIIPPIIFPPPLPPLIPGLNYRGCEVPNIDLDSLTYHPLSNPNPSDYNACGPAAAANSLHWLVQQHSELSGDTTSLRTKVEFLKHFMSLAQRDSNGVRFDSMVVGKLTLIDSLKLPIRVKYNTRHPSGFPTEPLVSENKKYGHGADNQGMLGVNPDFDWYKKEMDDGEDVEVHVGWYGPPDVNGNRTRTGGHWLVGTGYWDGGEAKGIFLKDDNAQNAAGGARHEYYEWDTLMGGIPFLRGLTDAQGRIGIVESLVSESFDPNILFTDVSKYDWSYRPIIYLSGSIQEDPYQAWLTLELPVNPSFEFLNARICSPDTSVDLWLVKNIPLPTMGSPLPVRVKLDLSQIVTGDTLPDSIIMKYHIGNIMGKDTFPIQSYAVLPAIPTPSLIGDGVKIGFHPLFPKLKLLPVNIDPFIGIESILRGCEVPNIDLDSLAYPVDPSNPAATDINACNPAAAANSLQWLDDQHDEFDIPLSIREILDTLKKYSVFSQEGGAYWDSLIMAKLMFIDEYKLPLHVKYQAHSRAPAAIPSPNPLYGHAATNASEMIDDTTYRHPTFEWLCQELDNGEDVELLFGYYCDTLVFIEVIDTILADTLPDNTIIFDTIYTFIDSTYLVRKAAHAINVTGKIKVGDLKWITYKHDVYQEGPGGTSPENTPDDYYYTDLSSWIEAEGGYSYLNNESYIDEFSDTCFAYVEAIITTSYDPDIEFCIEDAFLPDDDGEGTLRAAVACAKNGDTIRLTSLLANDTICLTSIPITIDKDIVIIADTSNSIYIKGPAMDRIFSVSSGSMVSLEGFKIICGNAFDGSCIKNAGDLTLKDMQFESPGGMLINNSKIENTGNLNIRGTTNIKK